MCCCCCQSPGGHRDLPVRPHSVPTRRSADLPVPAAHHPHLRAGRRLFDRPRRHARPDRRVRAELAAPRGPHGAEGGGLRPRDRDAQFAPAHRCLPLRPPPPRPHRPHRPPRPLPPADLRAPPHPHPHPPTLLPPHLPPPPPVPPPPPPPFPPPPPS